MYKLYIKQKFFKITDHYPVIDENQRERYWVDQDLKLFGNSYKITNTNTGQKIIMDKIIFRLLPEYQVSFPDGNIITIKQDLTFFKKSLSLLSKDYNLSIKGDFFDYNFFVYNGNELVGEINRKFLSFADTFEIIVFDPSFEQELIAILIAVDAIIDSDKRKSN